MHALPIGYAAQSAMDYFQIQPSWVKGRLNQETEVEKRYLYNKIFSLFDFKLPTGWPLNWFRFLTFVFGSGAAIYTRKLGWMYLPYGVSEIDAYYQPSRIIVSNHMLDTEKEGVIGLNAVIIRAMDDYCGLDDLVTKYATQLSAIDKSVAINLMNSNVALVAEAENKKDADQIKEAYAEATTGKPLVALNKRILDGGRLTSLIDHPKSNLMVMEFEQARQEILSRFLREIGIPTANYGKRAQMSDEEILQGDGETRALLSVMLDNLNAGFNELNRLSGMRTGASINREVAEAYRREAVE